MNANLLRSVVDLRLAIAATGDREVRGRLRLVEHRLRRLIGPSVPKREAAALLGVSVTALDRWIDRGRLPVVARPGSSRLGVERGPLLELAVEVERLRDQGVERGLLAKAFTHLGWHDDPDGRRVLRLEVAALPRPNVSARELRRDFEHTTAEERVLQLGALNRSLNVLTAGRRG